MNVIKNKVYISNFAYNLVYQISGIVIPLITMPYLARILKTEGMGKYSYAHSIAFLFNIIIMLGLQNYGSRTIAILKSDKKELSKVFWEIYIFQMVLGTFLCGIYIVYTIKYAPDILISFSLFPLVIAAVVDVSWFLYGMEEFKIASIRYIITRGVSTFLVFFFVKSKSDVWIYAFIYSSGFLIAQFGAIHVLIKNITLTKISIKGILKHVKPNIILFLPSIAMNLYKLLDKIMLGKLASDIELGYYHSCENIIKVPMAFITSLGIVMLPRMSRLLLDNDSNIEFTSFFNQSIKFAMFISTIVSFGIMSVANVFVPIFYGNGFEKCINIFYIILPSCVFVAFANVIRTQFLLPTKRDNIYVLSLIIGAGVNVCLNYYLIPEYKSIGAAIGTFITEFLVCSIQVVFVHKEINILKNIFDAIPFVVSGIVLFVFFHSYVPNVPGLLTKLFLKIFICGLSYLFILIFCIFIIRIGMKITKKIFSIRTRSREN